MGDGKAARERLRLKPPFLNHTESQEPRGHRAISSRNTHTRKNTYTQKHTHARCSPKAAQYRSIIMTNSFFLDTAGNIEKKVQKYRRI